MTPFDYTDIISVSPIIFLGIFALLLLIVDASFKRSANFVCWLTILGLLISGILTVNTYFAPGVAFNGMAFTGKFPAFFEVVFVLSAVLTVLLSRPYLERESIHFGEYYSLIVFATIGMMLMASARDLMVLFLGLELMSISLYVLAGFARKNAKSNEASLKYFLLGAFATGFLLYGISLVYGASGSTNLSAILDRFSAIQTNPLFWIGAALILVGLSFKISAVPFHMWVPDVYEGSPTTVAGFMSTGSKAAAFSALVLVFSYSIRPSWQLQSVIAYLAALTMILGNLFALIQQNIKRMLAYSSIAHAGYALIGIASANSLGRTGVLYYMLAYAFMQIGAFGVVSVLESKEGKYLSIKDYAGLSASHPFIAALMAIFMFSLAGIPPFAGFFGKYYLFASAVTADMTWLAIVGVLASVVSVYFYVGIVVHMYFVEETPEPGMAHSEENSVVGSSRKGDEMIAISKLGTLALIIAAAAVIGLGLTPSYIVALTEKLF
ncbi:MAG: NADH-quinone oxidoreductase subunit N [Candidatus Kryptoniota bacterium]